MTNHTKRPVLGAILSQFPRYDEAFILRELVELARGDWEIMILSLRPCRDRVIHDQAKALQPKTLYAPFVGSAALWRSHAWFLGRRPGAYLGALGWVVSRHWRHPVTLAKTLILFPKIVHFARLAAERGVAHLHAFWATYPTTAAIIINRLTGIPFSCSGHAHDIYTTNPGLAEKIRAARFVLTCTERNKQHLDRLVAETAPARTRGRSANVVVSYHGVDLSRFAAIPKASSDVCQMLAVGSLFACKGYETLIEGCRLLKSRGLTFHCTLAGGGPLEASLRALIVRHGLARDVEITGYVSQETVAGYYQRAHLFVLPLVSKIHWGIPNVVIEAVATKTPVVCCPLPSLKELIEHGTSGWLIPERDPQALAEAVETLWRDPGLRASMAEAGFQRVMERFALEKTGRELRDLFRAELGARNGTAPRDLAACGSP